MTLRIIIFFIEILHIAIIFFMVPCELDLLLCFSNRFFLINLFFWLRWVFVAVRGLSFQLGRAGATLRCGLSLRSVASLVVEHGLQACRLSSCGSRAQLLCGMWDLPGPGLKPVFPALAGRFLTTVPPGKTWIFLYIGKFLFLIY